MAMAKYCLIPSLVGVGCMAARVYGYGLSKDERLALIFLFVVAVVGFTVLTISRLWLWREQASLLTQQASLAEAARRSKKGVRLTLPVLQRIVSSQRGRNHRGCQDV